MTTNDTPDQMPIRISDWQKLHRILAIAPHRLTKAVETTGSSRVFDECQQLIIEFSTPVPVVVTAEPSGTGINRTPAGVAAMLLHRVRISTKGLDLIVGSRHDRGTDTHRAIAVSKIEAVEQAL